jgi:cysteine desulfurase
MFKRPVIYLDTASATPLDRRVWSVMKPFFRMQFANPASLHRPGLVAAGALEAARREVATYLSVLPDEIFFTSGGTESLNWAILGLARKFSSPRHLAISALEHEAVLAPCRYLEKLGWRISLIPADQAGIIQPAAVAAALNSDTVLVAVTAANNEIGSIEPLAEIAKVIRAARTKNQSAYPYFLTDACQAPRALDLSVPHLGVDLLALNGSKIYGPKGVGALFIRRGLDLEPLLLGGGQEQGLRSGTSNVPGIIGLATALKICAKERLAETKRLSQLRDYFLAELQKLIPDLIVNGNLNARLPSNLNISLPGLLGEQMVIELSAKGIACSAGAACSSLAAKGTSSTLEAIGLSPDLAASAIRFSLARTSTRSDLKFTAQTLAKIVAKYRQSNLPFSLII